MASTISGNVVPGFAGGSSVLTIKYKSGDPNQAALMANAFLAAAVDATIAMKVAGAEQTAQWFAPQIEALHKEFEEARSNVEAYQRANGELGADTQGAALNAVTQQLLGAESYSLRVEKPFGHWVHIRDGSRGPRFSDAHQYEGESDSVTDGT